jgi:hypothetical protein
MQASLLIDKTCSNNPYTLYSPKNGVYKLPLRSSILLRRVLDCSSNMLSKAHEYQIPYAGQC